jgi:hemerythrin
LINAYILAQKNESETASSNTAVSLWKKVSEKFTKHFSENDGIHNALQALKLAELSAIEQHRLEHISFSLNEMKTAAEIAKKNLITGE